MLKFQQKENGVLEKEKVMELILQGKEVIAKEKTSWRQKPIKEDGRTVMEVELNKHWVTIISTQLNTVSDIKNTLAIEQNSDLFNLLNKGRSVLTELTLIIKKTMLEKETGYTVEIKLNPKNYCTRKLTDKKEFNRDTLSDFIKWDAKHIFFKLNGEIWDDHSQELKEFLSFWDAKEKEEREELQMFF
ncbi:MAG: hypothetical protein ACOCRX_02355 [Candidatus Woesearchaeota archaeon]